MRSRRSFFAALAGLVAILFTQIAIAAAAWESAPMPCHDAAPANVCYEHCSHNDLTLDIPRIQIPEPVSMPAPVVHIAPARVVLLAPVRIGVLPAGPPPRILFQSFLI